MAEISVAITKGKANVTFQTDDLPEHVYAAALALGLKELANKGMSKITKALYADPEELKAAAMAKAAENVEAINAGTIKIPGQKAASKVSGAVMTEARRIARNMVKDAIKANGGKVSHVEARDITAAANALLASEEGAGIVTQATANLAERAKVPVSLAIISAIPISEKKVKAAEAKKAKDQLSAKQAGKVKPRAKGQQAAATAH
jgi:hypothetical protein